MFVVCRYSTADKQGISIIVTDSGTHIDLSHRIKIDRLRRRIDSRAGARIGLNLMEQTNEWESIYSSLGSKLGQHT